MSEIVLFHHAQGLTPGVERFADALRGDGHLVHTPDLYEGRTFAELADGVAHAVATGFDEIVARGERAAAGFSPDVVLAGFSLGVMPAQKLAQTRPGARGALLLHGCVPMTVFGAGWPAGVPVQIHGMDADPSFAGEGDIDAARELVAATGDAELFVYRGDKHLFTDSGLADYDAAAAALLMSRVKAFLARVG